MNVAVISKNKPNYSALNVRYITSDTVLSFDDMLEYDLAVLLFPYSSFDENQWTGHPHLRCCKNESEFEKELTQLTENIETELKYLIEYPVFSLLKNYNLYKSHIEQIYLLSDIGTRRIRKRSFGGTVRYYETVKVRLTDNSSKEYENLLSEKEYNELKELADPEKRPIVKDRYCFIYDMQYFELDVFEMWNDIALLEIEVCDENDTVNIPKEIMIIRDVSNDYRYKNSQLARKDYEDC